MKLESLSSLLLLLLLGTLAGCSSNADLPNLLPPTAVKGSVAERPFRGSSALSAYQVQPDGSIRYHLKIWDSPGAVCGSVPSHGAVLDVVAVTNAPPAGGSAFTVVGASPRGGEAQVRFGEVTDGRVELAGPGASGGTVSIDVDANCESGCPFPGFEGSSQAFGGRLDITIEGTSVGGTFDAPACPGDI